MGREIRKVVLAYSGGLDTSVIIKWLKENYQVEVIAYSADLGQSDDMDAVKEKALKTGASSVHVEDLKEEFVRGFAFRALKADARYEGKYLLATALARPLIAKGMVRVAEKEGADAVAHGSTGKGNDQVRFEVSIGALNPELEVLAPVREWEFGSREEEIDYALEHGIPVPATKESPYSLDGNLWGVSIECGVLEDPWREPPEEAYQLTVSPEDAPDTAEYVELEFESGVPIALDGERCGPVDLVEKLNDRARRHGVGRVDMVENRLVGIKSRGIYECPAATVLYEARTHLEDLVLDRETLHFKSGIGEKYAELVYYGLWYSPLRHAVDAFVDAVQERVTGEVALKLFKGTATVVGRRSPNPLYSFDLATYEASDTFDHSAAKGFVDLWGLPTRVWSRVTRGRGDEVR